MFILRVLFCPLIHDSPAFDGGSFSFRIKAILKEESSPPHMTLHVSKTLRPHLIHQTLLSCPSLPCITDSMNWHTYLLEPEISWGGVPEGEGGVQ